MGQVICIANNKGGVGKTTTAVNLSTAFAMAEKKTLLIDLDPSSNATCGIGLKKSRLKDSIIEAFSGKLPVERLIIDSHIQSLKVLPGNYEFSDSEYPVPGGSDENNFFQDIYNRFRKDFDFIIVDSPPDQGSIIKNSIAASDSILIPLQCEYYALDGIGKFLKWVLLLKQKLNTNLKIKGILLTMLEKRESLSSRIAEQARIHFNKMVFDTMIPRSTLLKESPFYGKPLLLSDIMSAPAQSYLALAREIMKKDNISQDS